MKNSLKTALLAGLISATTLAPAFSQPFIAMDEFGTLRINGLPAAPGVIAVDPISGLPTLSYALPFAGNPGDILLLEPGPQTNQISDVLRFVGNGRMFFFSDAGGTNEPPEPGVLADGPLPAIGQLPFVVFTETGPETGLNGLFGYAPGATGIGGDPSAPGVTYDFISDGKVPEPATIALVGLGLAAIGCRRRWRR